MKDEKKAYRYETHLHTLPVSRCAHASIRENLEFYKKLGYEGVFITNHFIDGSINIDKSLPYEERVRFFFSDHKEALRIGEEIGLSVFFGLEMSYKGTDFLVYGLGEDYFLAHPELDGMKKSEQLPVLSEAGGFVVHAHPFREASYIDHIRLFPKCVQGVEVYNANRKPHENEMAERYADFYGFYKLAGSDNHVGPNQKKLGGMQTDTPIKDVAEFIEQVKDGRMIPFALNIE